jgi:hypothetical protein
MKNQKKLIESIKETRHKIRVKKLLINEIRRLAYNKHGKPLRALKNRLVVLENELFGE